jgi:hypothetical protein
VARIHGTAAIQGDPPIRRERRASLASRPRAIRSRGYDPAVPRWVLTAVIGSTVVIAVVLGVLWYIIGGWPRDHDRYGRVAIPGQRTLELPKGEVRLSFEGQASGGSRTRTLEDPPDGLKVRVSSRRGRRQLKVESVSRSLYGVLSGDRGHEPFGRVDVPARGRYRVQAGARGATATGSITAGPSLWNPLGSPLVGAVAIFLAALLVLLFIELPLVLAAGRKRG